MKPRQNLFRLMFKEMNDGTSALVSFFSGQPFPERKKQAANVFNYLVYQRRKKTVMNKAS